MTYRGVRTVRPAVAAAVAALFVLGVSGAGLAAEDDQGELVGKLKESRLSLVDGIRQAAQSEGFPISAKFEMEDGQLMLSVYTAKEGRKADPEHNTLQELIGPSTGARWEPKKEVFEDKEHIARSAAQLTVMELTPLTLEDVIKKVAAQQRGTVYAVTPTVKDGKPVFDVRVATADGKSVPVTLDARTGNVIRY